MLELGRQGEHENGCDNDGTPNSGHYPYYYLDRKKNPMNMDEEDAAANDGAQADIST